MAVEEPKYTVVGRRPGFELRRYGELVVAETRMEGGQGHALQSGFRRLAGYIFGGNLAGRKIAMTAPVLLTSAEPGPSVLPNRGAWTVRFVMPSGQDVQSLPAPRDAGVRLTRVAGGLFAVARFSGVATPEAAAREASGLMARLQAEKLETDGPPALAQYDPPWTLWFLRRNEIIQRLRGF